MQRKINHSKSGSLTFMADSNTDSPESIDDDVQDDAVIGQAFRASLIGLMLLGLPVIGYLVYLNLKAKEDENTEVEDVILPGERKTDDSAIPSLPMIDVTSAAGIDFLHETGRYGDHLLPETMGSGIAVFDYNNDGNQDIFFANSSKWSWADDADTPSPGKLYAGNGEMVFTDVTAQAGLDFTLYGMGAAVGDIDNDGDTDLFLSAVGGNRLLRNDAGKFVDITEMAGVAGDDSRWSTSCCFFDQNNDGLLDLFVCSYVDWSKEKDLSQSFTLDGETRKYGPPKAFGGSFSYLYQNLGDGKFKDVSESAGVQIRNAHTDVPLGKAMGVVPIDVNDDGWMDIVVANDTVRNFYFVNNKDGTFKESGELVGIAYDRDTGNARGAMGIDAVIYRDDGTVAIGIGNFANEASALYMARPGRDQFIDAAMFTGFGPPTRQGLTFGLFFCDADLDGRWDVFGANGHLDEQIEKTQRTQKYAQSPQLFWNAGRDANSELVQVTKDCVGESFCDRIVGRGAAYGDFDNDGDQDIVIGVSGGKAKLFRNDQSVGNNWLRVKLQGSESNRDGIGARVTVKAGDRTWVRRIMPTRSYLSQCEKVATFGLGKSAEVTEAFVTWPGGKKQSFDVEQLGQTILVTESVD